MALLASRGADATGLELSQAAVRVRLHWWCPTVTLLAHQALTF